MATTTSKLIKKYGIPKADVIWESKTLILWDVPDDINKELPALPNRIYCNKDIVLPLELVFRDLIEAYHARELAKLDSILTWDGCFNIRKSRGLSNLSTHSWGFAVDINAFRNQLGKEPTFSKRFVSVWEKNGFEWGGYWNRPDGMHFQYNIDLLPEKK